MGNQLRDQLHIEAVDYENRAYVEYLLYKVESTSDPEIKAVCAELIMTGPHEQEQEDRLRCLLPDGFMGE